MPRQAARPSPGRRAPPRGALVLLAALLALPACREPGREPPRPTEVEPDRGPEDAAVRISIRGEGFAPRVLTDFGEGSASRLDARHRARLGAVALRDVRLEPDGTLTATVPEGLPPAAYELTVTDPWGSEGTLPDAYRVLSAGQLAELAVAFRIEPIGPQVAFEPFAATALAVDAQGSIVESYNGSAVLSDRTGAAVPKTIGQFSQGRWTGKVEIRAPHAADVLALADASGRTGSSNEFPVAARPPKALRFATPERTELAGACSAAVVLELIDDFGTPVRAPAAMPLSIGTSQAVGFTLFADAACATALAQASIPAGEPTLAVRFKGTRSGPVSLFASTAAVSGASQVETILPGPAASLAFTTAPQVLNAGACSQPATVQVRDAFGNAAPLAQGGPLSLSASPATLGFFADAACASPATSAAVGAGSSEATFHFRGTSAGAVAITAASAGWTSAQQTETIGPAAPDRLAFTTPPRSPVAGSCSAVLSVESRDAFGNPSDVSVATAVALSASPGAGQTFHSDAACTASATGLTIAAGTRSASFYLLATAAGSVDVTASVTGWSAATQVQAVAPAPPAALAFVTAPQVLTAGACSAAATLEVRDAYGNPSPGSPSSISLSASPSAGFGFYSDAGCTAAITGLNLAAGATRGSFYFRSTAAASVVVTATAAGLSPATQTETIGAGSVPTDLAFVTAAQSIVAGACSGVATVRSEDSFGNTKAVAADTLVSLSASPASGFTFFSDPTCTAPVAAVTIYGGSATASFYFQGTAAGPVVVSASAAALNADSQTEAVAPGPTAAFAWDAIPSPQAQDVAFGVTVRARDAYSNPTPSFVGTASLAVTPAGTVSCTASCTSATETGPFSAGVWTGSVRVGAPSGPGRQLVATSGALTGSSNAFEVTAPPSRSPPVARFSYSPAVIVAGQSVTFDAAASSDYETASAALEVSWDFTGTGGAPPWSAWSTSKTASNSYGTAGTYTARLAVRDSDGDIGFASHLVVVLASPADLCRVDTNADVDDGASSCTGPFGTDAKLSLVEAVRLSNAAAGTQTITFSGAMTIAGTGSLSITSPVNLVAPSGVILATKTISVSGGSSLISGLEMSGQLVELTVQSSGSLRLVDSYLHDMIGVLVAGTATLERVRLVSCTGDCLTLDASSASAVVRFSEFKDAAAGRGIRLRACTSGQALDLQSNVFVRLGLAVREDCSGAMLIRNNTFHANGTGIRYGMGGGHELRNNIFSAHSGDAVECAAVGFASRDYHLLYQNFSNGCLGGDPNALSSDPLYVYPATDDYRLQLSSPATDTALDLGVDVNDAAPGNYLGAGPDRGGRESY